MQEALEHAEKEVGDLESYNVLVDIEDNTHYLKHSIAEAANDFIQYSDPESQVEVHENDFSDWENPRAAYKLAETTEWSRDEAAEAFMLGKDEWPGFHEVSDLIWTGNTEKYDWMSDSYEIELSDGNVREKFHQLLEMGHVDNVEIVTSRGNFYSDYDVESAILERTSSDLDVSEEMVFFHDSTEAPKTRRDDPKPNVLIDDNHTMYQEGLEKDQVQLAVEAPHNQDEGLPGLVGSFGEAVDIVERLGE